MTEIKTLSETQNWNLVKTITPIVLGPIIMIVCVGKVSRSQVLGVSWCQLCLHVKTASKSKVEFNKTCS